jgi:gag-polyprotein putative aspartyl protease
VLLYHEPYCTSSKGEDFDSLDECLEAYSLAEYIRSQHNKNKRQQVDNYVDQDMRPLAFVRFNTSLGKPKPVTIKALLDSGASESLISKKYLSKLHVKSLKKKGTVWSTPGGDLHTNSQVKGQFTISELQDKKLIKWDLHVAENMGVYDMIIGRDILSFLKIDIRFSDQLVIWEGSEMPFKPVKASVTTDYHIAESMTVEEYTDRIKKILNAKYSATDLEKVCSSQSHLEVEKRQKLLALLSKFKDLFDGTLGKWNEEPIKLELKANATPYHARPFPIPS